MPAKMMNCFAAFASPFTLNIAITLLAGNESVFTKLCDKRGGGAKFVAPAKLQQFQPSNKKEGRYCRTQSSLRNSAREKAAEPHSGNRSQEKP